MTEGACPRESWPPSSRTATGSSATSSTGPSTRAPSGRCSSSPSSAPTARTRGCGPPARRSCATRRIRTQAASPTTAPRRPAAACPSGVIPCLTGNMVFSLIRLGMLDDPRVQRAVDWIAACQRFDDAEGDAPAGRPDDRYEMCWGRHTCSMGAIKGAQGPRGGPARAPHAGGARHHQRRRRVLPASPRPPAQPRPHPRLQARLAPLRLPAHVSDRCARDPAAPFHFAFLWFYRDERMREALDLVAFRADAQGRLRLQQTFNDRFWVPIETKGEPSRWVTMRALEVLGAAGRRSGAEHGGNLEQEPPTTPRASSGAPPRWCRSPSLQVAVDPVEHVLPVNAVGEVRTTTQRVHPVRRDSHDDVESLPPRKTGPPESPEHVPPRPSPLPWV